MILHDLIVVPNIGEHLPDQTNEFKKPNKIDTVSVAYFATSKFSHLFGSLQYFKLLIIVRTLVASLIPFTAAAWAHAATNQKNA